MDLLRKSIVYLYLIASQYEAAHLQTRFLHVEWDFHMQVELGYSLFPDYAFECANLSM